MVALYLIQHNNSRNLAHRAHLAQDRHDLIQSRGLDAPRGGKRNFNLEEKFVRKHAAVMPRTCCYAIERWPDKLKEVMR